MSLFSSFSKIDKDTILDAIGVRKDSLNETEQNKLLGALEDHIDKLIIRVFLENLPAESRARLQLTIATNPAKVIELVEEFATQTPELAEKTELAIAKELDLLKKARSLVESK